MSDLRTAAQQALAFTMRNFATVRDFEAARAVLHDTLKAALEQPEPCEYPDCVDNGPEGKCTRWLLAECSKSEDYKSHRPAEPVQEPVAWIQSNHLQLAQRGPFSCRVEPTQRHPDFVPLYTHPPRREWQSLSEEEIQSVIQLEREKRFQRRPPLPLSMTELSHAIEAALKEKNHD